MLPKQRVAWVEGMLMEPQHFQQQERYLEHLTEMRARSLSALAWGFHSLSINQGLLDQARSPSIRPVVFSLTVHLFIWRVMSHYRYLLIRGRTAKAVSCAFRS
ncbi:hypothetical protein L325_0122105 [Yersinia pestis 9]|nr:hypothetical protein L325_0122105 [Yersinia pestis 9]